MQLFAAQYHSPIGPITLAWNSQSLTGLWLENQKYFGGGQALPCLASSSPCQEELSLFRLASAWLDSYFAGEQPDPAQLPLAPAGSPFRQQVFALLLAIPYGHTTTYAKLAEKLGRPGASRAVGGAVGHNPISIIIPCHRVVGAGGSLTGYAGGTEKKRWLLQREGVPLEQLPQGKGWRVVQARPFSLTGWQ